MERKASGARVSGRCREGLPDSAPGPGYDLEWAWVLPFDKWEI